MVVTGINLKELVEQYDVAPLQCYDTFSLTLHLSRSICKYNIPNDQIVNYGDKISEQQVSRMFIANEYILNPGDSILACSSEKIKMPAGYIGFLQTKGSLARLYVTVHCCDGQVEPGFEGSVTFEICNLGQLKVRLLPECSVAQLFIYKTSSDKERYSGKYNQSEEPTYSTI